MSPLQKDHRSRRDTILRWALWAGLLLCALFLYLTQINHLLYWIIQPNLNFERQGLTTHIYNSPDLSGPVESELYLSRSQGMQLLSKPDTSAEINGIWQVPDSKEGGYEISMECDDYAHVFIDNQEIIRQAQTTRDRNHSSAKVKLEPGPHLLTIRLFNGPGEGWFRLKAGRRGQDNLAPIAPPALPRVNHPQFIAMIKLSRTLAATHIKYQYILALLICLILLHYTKGTSWDVRLPFIFAYEQSISHPRPVTRSLTSLGFLIISLTFTGLICWYSIDNGHDWGGDFSQYISQAISLWQGNLVECINLNRFTVEQSSDTVGPVAYPWGAPVMLTPFYAAFGLNMLGLKWLNIICYMLFIAVLWIGFRQCHNPFWRMLLVGLFAAHPLFLHQINQIGSTIPFLAFCTLCLLSMGWVVIQQKICISPKMDHVLIGICIAFAGFVRTEGLLLPAVLLLSQIMATLGLSPNNTSGTPRQRLAAAASSRKKILTLREGLPLFILPYISFGALFILWHLLLPEGGSSHFYHLRLVSMQTLQDNLVYYYSLSQSFFSGLPHEKIYYFLGLALALVGAYQRRKTDYHIFIFLFLFLLLMIVWPHQQGPRFLLPFFPFFISFALSGLYICFNFLRGPGNHALQLAGSIPVVIALVFFVNASVDAASLNLHKNRMTQEGPYTETARELFRFISQNTAPDSVIAFNKPRVLRLYAKRQSLRVYRIEDAHKVDYAAINRRSSYKHQVQLQQNQPPGKRLGFELVYENKLYQVYRVIKKP